MTIDFTCQNNSNHNSDTHGRYNVFMMYDDWSWLRVISQKVPFPSSSSNYAVIGIGHGQVPRTLNAMDISYL